MKILKRLKKSINTIRLFIRAFTIAFLLLKRTKKKIPHPKKKEPDHSVMGISRTVITGYENTEYKKVIKKEEEIDYEAESIPLETVEVSFESLEKLTDDATHKKMDNESRETLLKLETTELGSQIKNRISSLLDNAEFSRGRQSEGEDLPDLSTYLD